MFIHPSCQQPTQDPRSQKHPWTVKVDPDAASPTAIPLGEVIVIVRIILIIKCLIIYQ